MNAHWDAANTNIINNLATVSDDSDKPVLKVPLPEIWSRPGCYSATRIWITRLPFLVFGLAGFGCFSTGREGSVYLGSVTTNSRSPATSRSTCLAPLGHLISISRADPAPPKPKCTRESLEQAYPVLVVA